MAFIPKDFMVSGHMYRIGALDAFKQLHVARRLAPLLTSIGEQFAAAPTSASEAEADEWMMGALGPVAKVVSCMSDEDVNYVLHACLMVCLRQQPDERWARVSTNGKDLMFSDMDMDVLLRIAAETVKGNLGDFFPKLPAEAA